MSETQSLARQQENPNVGLDVKLIAQETGLSLPEVALIRHNMASSLRVAPGAVPLLDIAVFCKVTRSLGLDPLAKQAYWISRAGKPGVQISIDGYRAVADRAGNYAGSSEPVFRGHTEWSHRGKKLLVPEYAQVVVRKIVQGHVASFVGEARWLEYVPKATDAGGESDMWAKMPHNQLAKCAEAQALRKGWALQLGKVDFTTDEPALDVREQPQRSQAQLTADYDRVIGSNWDDDKAQESYVEHEQPAEEPKPDPRDKQVRKADEATTKAQEAVF